MSYILAYVIGFIMGAFIMYNLVKNKKERKTIKAIGNVKVSDNINDIISNINKRKR